MNIIVLIIKVYTLKKYNKKKHENIKEPMHFNIIYALNMNIVDNINISYRTVRFITRANKYTLYVVPIRNSLYSLYIL